MPNPILIDFWCLSCGQHLTSTTRCEHQPLLDRISDLETQLAAARAAGWQPEAVGGAETVAGRGGA